MIMKRAFIRTLWGTPKSDYDNGWIDPSGRRKKMDKDIDFILKSPYTSPFTTYVFGEENYNYLRSLNIDNCVLLDNRPFIYDLQKEFWRHKLDILKYAMEEDKYDEIVYIDWDCLPIKMTDENFWILLSKKSEIQANLQQYRRNKCKWRGKIDAKKVSNGGFIYIRDSKIPNALIKAWQELPPAEKFWDEIAISKLMDKMMGGWQGIEQYFGKFEPDVCNLKKKSVFENKLIENTYFIHYIQSANNRKSKNDTLEQE